jgi:hypothetical protein
MDEMRINTTFIRTLTLIEFEKVNLIVFDSDGRIK